MKYSEEQQKRLLKLVDERILHYDGQMEGADYDEFICVDWAAGAMRHFKNILIMEFLK